MDIKRTLRVFGWTLMAAALLAAVGALPHHHDGVPFHHHSGTQPGKECVACHVFQAGALAAHAPAVAAALPLTLRHAPAEVPAAVLEARLGAFRLRGPPTL